MRIILIILISASLTNFLYAEEVKSSQEEILRQSILKTFDKDKLIILAFERVYGDIFYVAKNFYQYKKTTNEPTYDGFYVWWMKNVVYQYDFLKGESNENLQSIIDNRITDIRYIEIQKTYELLEEIEKVSVPQEF